jgi:hypothetical protein
MSRDAFRFIKRSRTGLSMARLCQRPFVAACQSDFLRVQDAAGVRKGATVFLRHFFVEQLKSGRLRADVGSYV